MTNTTPAPIGADAALAKLRHLYDNLANGGVRDTAQAKRIAEGLLAPAIASLERAALASAAQPAAMPHAKMTEEIDNILSDPDTRMSLGAQRALRWLRTWTAAPKAAPAAQGPVAWMDNGSTRNGSHGREYRVVTDATKRDMPKAAAEAYVTPLYIRPAPAAQGDAEDAARYRWIAAHCRSTAEYWAGRWSIVVEGPAPKSHDSEDDFDAAIDAARAAKEGDKP